MKFILVTLGSHGDVHPFVGLGTRLRRRGHEVIVVANEHFESLIRREQLNFHQVGTDEDFRRLMRDPNLWHQRKGFETVAGAVMLKLREVYDAVVANLTADCVVLASSLALGARVARDELNFPLATVHLSPAVFRSTFDSPTLPGLPLRRVPRFAHPLIWKILDMFFIDPVVGPALNQFRATRGLPPVSGVLKDWWNSPDCIIGLFPDWYASIQPDWPAQTRVTGFPLYDERGLAAFPPELEEFLNRNEAPIAFTPGSAMVHANRFFESAIEACVRLGRGGILLTRHREQLPSHLPENVIHVSYAPFSELLPRVAAVVHHGGIGSTAQALAAGAPQLVTPMTHDQPDNAARLRRLGVAEVVPFRRFSARRATRSLRKLLETPAVRARCREIALRFKNVDSLEETCDLVENLAPGGTESPQAISWAG